MKTVKIIIFFIGILLANYVGGIPKDSKNLFITHTIFLAPYLVDYYPLVKMKSHIKYLARVIWGAGILILVANILGIIEVINIVNSNMTFNKEYVSPIPLNIKVDTYLLIAGVVYAAVFMGTITLSYATAYNEHMIKKKKAKQSSKKQGLVREELVENVSSR